MAGIDMVMDEFIEKIRIRPFIPVLQRELATDLRLQVKTDANSVIQTSIGSKIKRRKSQLDFRQSVVIGEVDPINGDETNNPKETRIFK